MTLYEIAREARLNIKFARKGNSVEYIFDQNKVLIEALSLKIAHVTQNMLTIDDFEYRCQHYPKHPVQAMIKHGQPAYECVACGTEMMPIGYHPKERIPNGPIITTEIRG